MIKFPDDLPIVERSAVRLAVLDVRDRLLLFHTREPYYPELGTWWELPGGGIEVGQPTWRRRASFRHRDVRRVQDEVIVTVRLATVGPEVDESGRFDYEKEEYFGYRWWPVGSVIASRERFYPGRLPTLLPRFLSGEEIAEPFELWS